MREPEEEVELLKNLTHPNIVVSTMLSDFVKLVSIAYSLIFPPLILCFRDIWELPERMIR